MRSYKQITAVLTAIALTFSFTVSPVPTISLLPERAAAASGDLQENYAASMLELINQERTANGLNALELSEKANAAALVRSQETAALYEHTRPDGSSCYTALQEAGIASFRQAAENVICTSSASPAAAFTIWMNSTGHRDNILKENMTTLGVGCYYDPSNADTPYYWAIFLLELQENASDSTGIPTNYAETLLTEINAFRAENGLNALRLTSELNQASEVRAKELAESFAYNRPDGTAGITAIPEDFTYRTIMAQIAAGESGVEDVAEQLLNTEHYKEQLLNPDINAIGIGAYTDVDSQYQHYWHLFLAQTDAAETEEELTIPENYAAELLDAINAYRAENDLEAIVLVPELQTAAVTRAQELVQTFSHTRPDGSSFKTAIPETYVYQSVSELLPAGRRIPADVLAQMLTSEEYRTQLLNADIDTIGIGAVADASGKYQFYWDILTAQSGDIDTNTNTAIPADYAETFLTELNKARAAQNQPAVTLCTAAAPAALTRVLELAEDFSHQRPNGGTLTALLPDDLAVAEVHELVAAGKQTPEEALEQFLDTSSNAESLLGDTYDSIAVGAYYDADAPYQYYWTVLLLQFPDTEPPTETQEETIPSISKDVMLEAINEIRQTNGLTPLTEAAAADSAADIRVQEVAASGDLSNYTRPDGSKSVTAFPSDYSFISAQEVHLATGAIQKENLLQILGSNEAILKEQANTVGIGVQYDAAAGYYVWVLFVLQTEENASTEPMLGDVDGNGTVTVLDVLTLNKNLLGLEVLDDTQRKAADVDGSGTADATDSLNILKYVVKLLTSFDTLSAE